MPKTTLTQEERRQFFRDGYIVIENAVPVEISQKAREVITAKLPKNERRLLAPPELATHESILSLFSDTRLAEIMRDVMGPFPDVISSQVAVTPPYDTLGDKPGAHVDGSWSGVIPDRADEIDLTRGRHSGDGPADDLDPGAGSGIRQIPSG